MKNRRTRPFKRSNNRHSGDSFVNGNSSTRVRGNLSTVLEKYKVLAKDAAASGDHVGAENYLMVTVSQKLLKMSPQMRKLCM